MHIVWFSFKMFLSVRSLILIAKLLIYLHFLAYSNLCSIKTMLGTVLQCQVWDTKEVMDRVTYKFYIMMLSWLQGQARSTWATSAYQSPTSLLGSISGPPVDDSWSFRDTGCKRTADGLSLLLARRPGTHCLTILETRTLAETASANFWNRICSLVTETSSALRGFTRMRYTNLLTYLQWYAKWYVL